ncbi:TPA: O-antigen ligase family protein [Photobacterium damselae]
MTYIHTHTYKKFIIPFIINLPIFSLFSVGMFYYGWDKKVIVLFIIAIGLALYSYGVSTILKNSKNRYLQIILITILYGWLQYEIHGYSSNELRTLIVCFLCFLSIPNNIIANIKIKNIIFIAAIFSFGYLFYNTYILHVERASYPFNPIPYATGLTTLAITSLLLIKSKKDITLIFSYLLFISGILLTETRGALLAISISSILYVFIILTRMYGYKKSIFYVGIMVAIFSMPAYKIFEYRGTNHEIAYIKKGDMNTSIGIRLQLWEYSPHVIKRAPIIGSGENFSQYMSNDYHNGLISKSVYDFKPNHFHNQFIDKLVKSGTIGLSLLLLMLVYPCIKSKNINIIFINMTFILSGLTDVPFGNSFSLFFLIFLNWYFLIPITNNRD